MCGAPPEAVVIDLGRLPSHGREVGHAFRSRKATRHVPLVFVGGAGEKLERVRALLLDAVFTGWPRIKQDLKRAIANPPVAPATPPTMAGYSGTPLPKKLGIKPGMIVSLVNAPDDFERLLDIEANFNHKPAKGSGIVLLFAESQLELERRFASTAAALAEKGSIWIVWPKQSSGVRTDLDQPAVRSFGLERGFVDYKICAVDETWSGLLFTRRR